MPIAKPTQIKPDYAIFVTENAILTEQSNKHLTNDGSGTATIPLMFKI